MRTANDFPGLNPTVYTCELEWCPHCEAPLEVAQYVNGRKPEQTLNGVVRVAYRPCVCVREVCAAVGRALPSAAWAHVAPKYGTSRFDVIAQIGWARQKEHAWFERIQAQLAPRIHISESQVHYVYHRQYLPLVGCQEPQHLAELQSLARTRGLILGLDGLVVEGGEPQLWVVRELQKGWTLRFQNPSLKVDLDGLHQAAIAGGFFKHLVLVWVSQRARFGLKRLNQVEQDEVLELPDIVGYFCLQ
jgi:hypothetical protein